MCKLTDTQTYVQKWAHTYRHIPLINQKLILDIYIYKSLAEVKMKTDQHNIKFNFLLLRPAFD